VTLNIAPATIGASARTLGHLRDMVLLRRALGRAKHHVFIGAAIGMYLLGGKPQRDFVLRFLRSARGVDEVSDGTAAGVGDRRRVDRDVAPIRSRLGEHL
jgi:hypothetical protein